MRIFVAAIAGIVIVAFAHYLVSNFLWQTDATENSDDAVPIVADDRAQDTDADSDRTDDEDDGESVDLEPLSRIERVDVRAALAEALDALASAHEDSPEADAALEQALVRLQSAREALLQQDPSCCDDDDVCAGVTRCVPRDARVVVHLPPVGSRPALTRQGAQSFATLFAAAAARGVENASIRGLNGVWICPICNEKHAPNTPCPADNTPGVSSASDDAQ